MATTSSGSSDARGLAGVIATVVAVLLVGIPAVAAFAQNVSSSEVGADLTGATGQARSRDAKGALVSEVSAPGALGASPQHPFLVDRNGRVTWSGSTPQVITDHHWTVSVYALPVKSGGSANTGRKTSASGTEKVGDYLKVPMVGLYRVNGQLSGRGGSVTGTVWIKVTGSPVGTPVWFFGLFCAAAGMGLAQLARPSAARL